MSESLSRLLRAGPRQSGRGSRCQSRRFLLLLWGAAFTESTCQQVPPFCPCPGPSPEPRHLLSEAAFNFSFWTCQGKASLAGIQYVRSHGPALRSDLSFMLCCGDHEIIKNASEDLCSAGEVGRDSGRGPGTEESHAMHVLLAPCGSTCMWRVRRRMITEFCWT